ncbi:hypothetical protein ABZV75_22805 [Streptomyces flaveolus]|uniref:hypothetical protein n=1 Tax=Streptomyces flaveolus TaxID=67297 RepID=UPI0033A56647
MTGEDGAGELAYDTLFHALGSSVAHHGVPGAAEYAFDVTGRSTAPHLRERLADLGEGGTVLVVGEGLTGIGAVSAEPRPSTAGYRPAQPGTAAAVPASGSGRATASMPRSGMPMTSTVTPRAARAFAVCATVIWEKPKTEPGVRLPQSSTRQIDGRSLCTLSTERSLERV